MAVPKYNWENTACCETSKVSGDTAIKSAPGVVFWISVSDTADLEVELNDSTNNSGTDKWGIKFNGDSIAHFVFDPPIYFGTGIYLDVSTTSCVVTVGYV
jgi:hypothetical protein